MKPGVQRIGHGIVAGVACIALLLQLALVVVGVSVLRPEDDPGLVGRLARLVSYFTIQSNILVAAVSVSLARNPRRDSRLWRVARLDSVMGIVVTGVVHWFLLRPLLDLHGLSAVADTLLHIIVPVIAVAAWIVLGPRRRITGRTILLGLVWPTLWTVSTLVVGAVTGWYPYPFLDVGALGPMVVGSSVVVVAVLMVVVELTLWGLDRLLRVGSDGSVSSNE